MDLQGKVCLVTGGTSGIGAAAALTFAKKGAHVAIVARKSAATPGDLLRCQGSWRDYPLPASRCRRPRRLAATCVAQVIKQFGRLDVLVHSAGGAVPGNLYTIADETWMNAFAVHVHAVFHLTRAAAPHMAQQGEGAIIL